MAQDLRDALDRIAIEQILARYCHAVDRRDRDMLASVYWDDSYDIHISFQGRADAFIDWLMDLLKGDYITSHILGQSSIELDGDEARVETYVMGHHARPNAEGDDIVVVGTGRYIDRFEKRGGEWRIARREMPSLDCWREERLSSVNDEFGLSGAAAVAPRLPKIGRPTSPAEPLAMIRDYLDIKRAIAVDADGAVFLGQSLIRQDEDRAQVETYFQSQQAGPEQAAGGCATIAVGRRLDQLRREGGGWRMAHRDVAVDFVRSAEVVSSGNERTAGAASAAC